MGPNVAQYHEAINGCMIQAPAAICDWKDIEKEACLGNQ